MLENEISGQDLKMNFAAIVTTLQIPMQCYMNVFKPIVAQNHLMNGSEWSETLWFFKKYSILSKTVKAIHDSTLFLAILTYLCSIHHFE